GDEERAADDQKGPEACAQQGGGEVRVFDERPEIREIIVLAQLSEAIDVMRGDLDQIPHRPEDDHRREKQRRQHQKIGQGPVLHGSRCLRGYVWLSPTPSGPSGLLPSRGRRLKTLAPVPPLAGEGASPSGAGGGSVRRPTRKVGRPA